MAGWIIIALSASHRVILAFALMTCFIFANEVSVLRTDWQKVVALYFPNLPKAKTPHATAQSSAHYMLFSAQNNKICLGSIQFFICPHLIKHYPTVYSICSLLSMRNSTAVVWGGSSFGVLVMGVVTHTMEQMRARGGGILSTPLRRIFSSFFFW